MTMRTTLAFVCLLGGTSVFISGCGMRSVLNEDADGPEPKPVVVDAGAPNNNAGSGAVDASTGTHACGRPGADGCDVEDLDGHSCQSLGAGSGTLACDPATCVFDLSMCTGAPIGTGTGGTSGNGNNAGTSGGNGNNAGTSGGNAGTSGGFFGGGNAGTSGGFFGGGNAGTSGGFFGGGGNAGTRGGFFGGGNAGNSGN